jgi:hypothetical protein
VRDQKPDFHIDYLVEITEVGELTGIQFAVQLKGWRSKKNHLGVPKYVIKTKHLAYYVDKCEMPVFLLLIDVKREIGYWTFMQKFGKDADPAWRSHKKISVEFDQNNLLSNNSRFLDAIRNAAQYTRDLHPSSINAALQHARKMLEAKDPRVAVKIDVVDGIQRVTVNAKEDFPFTMKFKTDNPSTVENINNFFEKGDDLKIKANEIEIIGAPFLDFANQGDGPVLIQHKKEFPGHALLSWDECDVLAHVHLPGRFWAGCKYLSCEVALPNAPLNLTATIPPEDSTIQKAFNVTYGLRAQPWEGQPLLALAYFNQLYALVKALTSNAPVMLRLYVQGNLLGSARMNKAPLKEIFVFWNFLEMLRKARLLAQHFKVNVVMPPLANLSSEDYDVVDELFAIVIEGGHKMVVPGVTISCTLSGTVPQPEPNTPSQPLIITRVESYSLLGTRINVGQVEIRVTDLKLTMCEPTPDGTGTKVVFKGTNQSERFIRLVDRVLLPPTIQPLTTKGANC